MCISIHTRKLIIVIVFKPGLVAGPVQGLGSGFWPGHQVARVNSFFKKKSKWRHFSKKKMSISYNQVFDRVLSGQPARQPGHTGFFLSLFFLQPGLVSAPNRPDPKSTCRAELNFKTIIIIVGFTIKPNNIPTKWENKMGPHFFLMMKCPNTLVAS